MEAKYLPESAGSHPKGDGPLGHNIPSNASHAVEPSVLQGRGSAGGRAWLPSSSLPIHIPTAALTTGPHPCRSPSRAGPRAGGRGHRRSPLDRIAGDERPRPGPRRAAFNRAANLNPYRRHRRQARIPAAPLTSEPAGVVAGDPARPERRRPAPTALWQAAFIRPAKPHPYRRHRRQAASLPPPHERASGQAGRASGPPARPECR